MRRLLVLGAAGAAAWYAAKRGHLPALVPIVDQIEGRAAKFLPESLWTVPDLLKEQQVAQIREASGGRVVPILGQDEVISLNPYEAMLRANMRDVSGWASKNIGWASAICMVENAQRNPKARGDGGAAYGVLQVHLDTAETCYRAGYTNRKPTAENLLTVAGGIYFGTAEMERLSKIRSELDWVILAYNGGAGWEDQGDKYKRDRQAYLTRVKRAFAQLYGKDMA